MHAARASFPHLLTLCCALALGSACGGGDPGQTDVDGGQTRGDTAAVDGALVGTWTSMSSAGGVTWGFGADGSHFRSVIIPLPSFGECSFISVRGVARTEGGTLFIQETEGVFEKYSNSSCSGTPSRTQPATLSDREYAWRTSTGSDGIETLFLLEAGNTEELSYTKDP